MVFTVFAELYRGVALTMPAARPRTLKVRPSGDHGALETLSHRSALACGAAHTVRAACAAPRQPLHARHVLHSTAWRWQRQLLAGARRRPRRPRRLTRAPWCRTAWRGWRSGSARTRCAGGRPACWSIRSCRWPTPPARRPSCARTYFHLDNARGIFIAGTMPPAQARQHLCSDTTTWRTGE